MHINEEFFVFLNQKLKNKSYVLIALFISRGNTEREISNLLNLSMKAIYFAKFSLKKELGTAQREELMELASRFNVTTKAGSYEQVFRNVLR